MKGFNFQIFLMWFPEFFQRIVKINNFQIFFMWFPEFFNGFWKSVAYFIRHCKYLYWHRRQHEFRAVSLTMWFQRDAIRARIQLSRGCSLSTVPRDAYGKWVCHLLWRRCCRICRLGSTRVWVAPLWRAEACPLTSPAGEGCGACMSVLLSWCRDFGHCHHEKSVLSCLKNSWTSFVGEYVHFVHTENTSFWGKRKNRSSKKGCSPNLLETLPPMLEEELPEEPWWFRWCLREPRLLRLVLEPVSYGVPRSSPRSRRLLEDLVRPPPEPLSEVTLRWPRPSVGKQSI